MVIQGWCLCKFAFVVSQIETHVIEDVSCFHIDLHFGGRETINEPIESVVFLYAVVDEFCIFCGDCFPTERLAGFVALEHSDLMGALEKGDGGVMRVKLEKRTDIVGRVEYSVTEENGAK